MGAYSNPDVNVGIDRQSGQMIGQAIAGIGQKIGGAITQRAEKIAAAEKEVAERKRKEAEKARIRAEQNWRIHKAVESQRTQAVVDFESTLESQNIDVESLNGSFKGVIDELYEAKDRLAQSRGDYEGRKDDEAMIRNNTAFISGLKGNFESMNGLMGTWKERFKLRDKPGGIDNSATDPLFAAMMEIGQGSTQGIGAGSIGWETRTGPGGKKQLFQVARSEAIRELNWINGGKKGELKNASDTYELGYDQVRSFLEDDDNNPNTFGPFSLVPDDSAERKKDLQLGGVIGEDGKITQPDENGQGGFYSKGKQVKAADGRGSYWSQSSWPNTEKIRGQIGTYAKSSAQAELSFGGSSVTANSNIRANALKREITINGKKATQYYIPTYGKRDSEGKLEHLPELILGDSINGIMSQGGEEGTEETDGYSPEEYEKYIKFTEHQYMAQAGAFANPISITPDKRDYIEEDGTGITEHAEVYYDQIIEDPLNRWKSVIPDTSKEKGNGSSKMEEGVLIDVDLKGKTTKFNFNVNEDGTFVEPKDVEQYVRLIVKNDNTIGNTKEDRALVGKIIEQIREKQVEVEVEEEKVDQFTKEDLVEIKPYLEETYVEINNIVNKDKEWDSSKKYQKVEAILNQAIENFKIKGKNVSKEFIINKLIKAEKIKRERGMTSKPGIWKGVAGGFDIVKVLEQLLVDDK